MRIEGPWSRSEIDRFLDEAVIPLRLACQRERGDPLVASHWFVRRGESLWCALRPRSAVARHLARDPRCGFEVSRDAPPYFGVRGSGRAELREAEGAEVIAALVDRYLGRRDSALARWLLGRAGVDQSPSMYAAAAPKSPPAATRR